MRRLLHHTNRLPATGSPQLVLRLRCFFFSHTHFWSETHSFLYLPFLLLQSPLAKLHFCYYNLLSLFTFKSLPSCQSMATSSHSRKSRGVTWCPNNMTLFMNLNLSERAASVLAVAQLGDSTSKFLTYDGSLVREECFIEPKKMTPGFLKTGNNDHTSRLPRQALIYKKKASERSTCPVGEREKATPSTTEVLLLHACLTCLSLGCGDNVGQVADTESTDQNRSMDHGELGTVTR